MNEHEENLRDLAAMFAMCGLIMRNDDTSIDKIVERAFTSADKFMSQRSIRDEEVGIAALKPRRKKAV
jgi:hypothetical protein